MASDNEYRPGFFEVYAANHLSTALRPALRFALDVLSVRHPFLIRIAARSDEIFTAVLLLLETSQLRKESALLAESFYSLRRSKNLSFRPNELIETPLQGKQVFLSILFGVILPHTKTKLDSWYSDATGGAAAALFVSDEPQVSHSVTTSQDSRQMSDNSSAVRLHLDSSLVFNPVRTFARLIRAMKHFLSSPAFLRMVLRWYPRISTCCEGTNLLFNILYLFRHTRYFTLALALQGLVLRRATPTETMKSSSRSTPFFTEGNRSFNLTQVLSATSERVLAVFKMSFFMGIFAFRFLQYYYAAEASVPRESGPVVPPPEPLPPANGVDRGTALASKSCPLCNRVRVNPTACSTSGYIFCYLCIYTHVQQSANCPVTLAPANLDDLVRVYDDASTT